jgi:hypothetical protein
MGLRQWFDSVRTTYKSSDIEETVDYWVHRPVAAGVVSLLKKTPITPNQVTILSGLVGIAAGLVLGFADSENVWMAPLAGVLLFASVILDCCDGQLARIRGESSLLGRALDGFVDSIPVIATFIATLIFLHRAGYNNPYCWALGSAAGLSFRWHCYAYDEFKGVYLANTIDHNAASTDLQPSIQDMEAERDRLRAAGKHLSAFVVQGMIGYTRSQRVTQNKAVRTGVDGLSPGVVQKTYRTMYYRLMRLWAWNGIGTHHAVMVTAMLLTPVYDGALLLAWWVIALPMNVLAVGNRFYERALNRRFDHEIDALKN